MKSYSVMYSAYATQLHTVSPGKIAFVTTGDAEPAAVATASLYWRTRWSPKHHKHIEQKLAQWMLEGKGRFAPLLSSHSTGPGPSRLATIPPAYISRPAEERCDDIRSVQHAERAFVDPVTGDPVLATYYPPTNPEYEGGLPGELPPVVVNMRGGPGADFSHHGVNWDVQFFTSRGFAWYAQDQTTLHISTCRPF